MAKATKEDLQLLHKLTAKLCLDILQNGEVVKLKTEDGEEPVAVRVTPSASLLAVVTKFLKDNCIVDDGLPAPNAGRDLAAEARALSEEDHEDLRPN